MRDFDAVMFVTEAPEFDYIGGLFHIRQKVSDECVIERVMSPHIFMLALRRAAEAASRHKFGSAEIIDFPKSDEAPAQHG